MEFKIPSFDLIVDIHELVIDEFGGLKGFPHPKYIESTIARPKHYMAYQETCDIHLVSALIIHSIATHHPFADGNKRTALIAMLMTYRLNGIYLSFDTVMNKKFERLVLRVAKTKPEIKSIRRSLMRLVKEFESK